MNHLRMHGSACVCTLTWTLTLIKKEKSTCVRFKHFIGRNIFSQNNFAKFIHHPSFVFENLTCTTNTTIWFWLLHCPAHSFFGRGGGTLLFFFPVFLCLFFTFPFYPSHGDFSGFPLGTSRFARLQFDVREKHSNEELMGVIMNHKTLFCIIIISCEKLRVSRKIAIAVMRGLHQNCYCYCTQLKKNKKTSWYFNW